MKSLTKKTHFIVMSPLLIGVQCNYHTGL